MPSALQDAVTRQRDALLRKERNASSQMVRVYGDAWRDIKGQLDSLTAKMQAARDAGEVVKPAWLYQFGRLHNLQMETERKINEFSYFAEQLIVDQQRDAVDAASRNAEALTRTALGAGPRDHVAQVMTSFDHVPDEALRELVGRLSDGSPLRSLLDELGPAAGRGIEQALLIGIAQGHNPVEIARNARQFLGGNLTRALTIARTEMLGSYREATRRSYEKNRDVVKGWIWSAETGSCCICCLMMNGTQHAVEDELDGHPNCRCAMVPLTWSWKDLGFEGIEDTQPEIPTGAEMWDDLSEARQLDLVGRRGLDLIEEGELNPSDFVGRRENPQWGSMRYANSVKAALELHQRAEGGEQILSRLFSAEEHAALEDLKRLRSEANKRYAELTRLIDQEKDAKKLADLKEERRLAGLKSRQLGDQIKLGVVKPTPPVPDVVIPPPTPELPPLPKVRVKDLGELSNNELGALFKDLKDRGYSYEEIYKSTGFQQDAVDGWIERAKGRSPIDKIFPNLPKPEIVVPPPPVPPTPPDVVVPPSPDTMTLDEMKMRRSALNKQYADLTRAIEKETDPQKIADLQEQRKQVGAESRRLSDAIKKGGEVVPPPTPPPAPKPAPPVPEPAPVPKPEPAPKSQARTGYEIRKQAQDLLKDTQARIDDLVDRSDAIMEEIRSMQGSDVLVQAKRISLRAEYNANYDLMMSLRQDAKKQIHELLRVENPTVFKTALVGYKNKNAIAEVEDAVKWLQSVTEENRFLQDRSVRITTNSSIKRSYHKSGEGVFMDRKSGKQIVVHELGHWMEDRDPTLGTRAQAFLKDRAGHESPQRLSVLTGYSAYGPDEVAYKDHFLDPYMGKVYRSATEIMSMGLELMYSNPAELLDKDPDMFEFVVDSLRGIRKWPL